MNDPAFFPELGSTNFPILMKSARDALEKQGARVCDGSDFLGKVVCRDAMPEVLPCPVCRFTENLLQADSDDEMLAQGDVGDNSVGAAVSQQKATLKTRATTMTLISRRLFT